MTIDWSLKTPLRSLFFIFFIAVWKRAQDKTHFCNLQIARKILLNNPNSLNCCCAWPKRRCVAREIFNNRLEALDDLRGAWACVDIGRPARFDQRFEWRRRVIVHHWSALLGAARKNKHAHACGVFGLAFVAVNKSSECLPPAKLGSWRCEYGA